MPALRDRAEDIPYSINDLIARMEAANRGSVRLSHKAVAVLMQHHWSGNVRELSNLIERLAIINPEGTVDAADLPEKCQGCEVLENAQPVWDEPDVAEGEADESMPVFKPAPSSVGKVQLPEQGIDPKEYPTDLESELIRQALEECNGVVAHAAKPLNMRRTALVEKLRKVDAQWPVGVS